MMPPSPADGITSLAAMLDLADLPIQTEKQFYSKKVSYMVEYPKSRKLSDTTLPILFCKIQLYVWPIMQKWNIFTDYFYRWNVPC